MTTKPTFTVYPALDLRRGEVVRLKRGDPGQQTTYASDPLDIIRGWLDQGVRWLHMVNLDGAFGEKGSVNYKKIGKISQLIHANGASIQYGGGLRSIDAINTALELGISRAILGTIAVEDPAIIEQAIEIHGPAKILVSLDASDGYIRTRGWLQETPIKSIPFGKHLYAQGVRWAIYTDISRDGMGSGANIDDSAALAQASGLNVIVAGGVKYSSDLATAREAGLAGIIVGRAIYEGSIGIDECIQYTDAGNRNTL